MMQGRCVCPTKSIFWKLAKISSNFSVGAEDVLHALRLDGREDLGEGFTIRVNVRDDRVGHEVPPRNSCLSYRWGLPRSTEVRAPTPAGQPSRSFMIAL